ncbi:peptide chain release factor 1, mitochondrial [Pogona vitticeps]
MKPLPRIPVFRTFVQYFWCQQRCCLSFLAKRSTHLAEWNISQHSCLWNRVAPIAVLRRYNQTSGTLWNYETLQKYLQTLTQEYQTIGLLLNDYSMNEYKRKDLSKRYAELSQLALIYKEIQETEKEMQDLLDLCENLTSSEDKPLLEVAVEEKRVFDQKISTLYRKLFQVLIPREKWDESNVVLELISGRTTGGDICQQFTQEILDMYQNYADYKNWAFEIVKYVPSDQGGLHHATALISGDHVYMHLKYEGGIHRVQRIPETGLSARMQRIHTGTMSVIVLPQLEEVKIKVDPGDLRIDTFRAKGAGGQHVNKTDSAVRIVHIPTGLSVECQQERSMHMNKAIALQSLKKKLHQQAIERELSQRNTSRKLQLGERAQSERIRTYNFSQDRVTDHRISYDVHNIKEFLSGRELLDELISKLLEAAEMEALLEHLENNFKPVQSDM